MALAALTALLLLCPVAPARADLIISTSQTINGTVDDNVQVIGTAVLDIKPPGYITGGLTTRDSSTANVSGVVQGSVVVEDNSTVNVIGGLAYHDVTAVDNSTANLISGSMAGIVQSSGMSTANLRGGSMGWLVVDGAGTARLSGGTIGHFIFLGVGGTLHVYGCSLSLTAAPPPAGKYLLNGVLLHGPALAGTVLFAGSPHKWCCTTSASSSTSWRERSASSM